MISKNLIKYLNSLTKKKYRYKERKFICEGRKTVEALLASDFEVWKIFATGKFVSENPNVLQGADYKVVTDAELKKISTLTTPQGIVAVAEMPFNEDLQDAENKLIIVLDRIQDPGNLGTIVRLADWFGADAVVCSQGTVDVYSPKTVQATMGSIFSVKVHYTDLENFLEQNSGIPIYGTFMDGENIYEQSLSKTGIIVMGNEANGISETVKSLINRRLAIPSFNTQKTAESLNVAVATAIVLSEFARRK